MHWEAVIEFPKMKVAVATREARVAEIRYLPLTADSKAPENELAERAARQLERYREDPDARFGDRRYHSTCAMASAISRGAEDSCAISGNFSP